MRRFLQLLTVISIVAISAMGASVKATVDDPNVVAGNSVRLTIEAVGDDVVFPQIGSVGPYPVESRSRMSSMGISSINGQSKMEKSSKLIVTFTPDKAMTIPAFSVQVDGKTMQTNPIDIKIVKASAHTPAGSQKFSLDMVANKKKVFVGEPLVLSVFFNESRQADLMKVEYQKPVSKDFFIKELGNEKTYQKGAYLVHELRYLLTPKYEGNLTIEPARARVAERGHRRDEFFGTFFDTPVWKRIVSNRITIDVKPSPQNTDLVGDFTISDSVDASEVKANKPVNLTLKITGEGNLEDFEGPKYDIDGVTIYSDDPRVENHLSGNKLISTFEKKYVFIADHNFTIPSRSFSVFDYKTGKVKELKTQEHHITVKGGEIAAPAVIHSEGPQAKAENLGTDLHQPAESEEVQKLFGTSAVSAPWMLAVRTVVTKPSPECFQSGQGSLSLSPSASNLDSGQ